jgi:hypothetical protein
MGSHHSNQHLTTDLVDSSLSNNDMIFKVDNINSHGRKHSTAKIQITNDDLCIRQKHRHSMHIPLDTIKRYGLDGSIFILECGRRAPLGQARYAFRCKHARRLTECLDQRINMISEQLFTQEQAGNSSSTLTHVSSMFNDHGRRRRRRRTQSDYGRSPSPMSLSSATSFYRNSEPDLSENYFALDAMTQQRDTVEQQTEHTVTLPMNYMDFKKESSETSTSSIEQTTRHSLSAAFEPPQYANPTFSDARSDDNMSLPIAILTEPPSTNKAYVYIDHEKTNALKDIAQERLQHHARRIEI